MVGQGVITGELVKDLQTQLVVLKKNGLKF